MLTRYTLLHHSPAFYTVVPWHLSFPRSLPSFSINVLFTQSYILVIHVLAFWGGHRNERGCLLFNFFFFAFFVFLLRNVQLQTCITLESFCFSRVLLSTSGFLNTRFLAGIWNVFDTQSSQETQCNAVSRHCCLISIGLIRNAFF